MKRIFALLLALLLLGGCASVERTTMDEEPAPPPQEEPAPVPEPEPEEAPPVFADWTVLEDAMPVAEEYTQYWGAPQETLRPDDGYGMLYPFPGRELVVPVFGYPETMYRYGLANAAGQVAVEPVYDTVYLLSWGGENLPVYILSQSEADATGEGRRLYGAAAQDGSWALPVEYAGIFAIGPERLLLIEPDMEYWLGDLEGNLEKSPLEADMNELYGPWWMEMNVDSEIFCMTGQNGCWLVNFLTGEARKLEDIGHINTWSGGAPYPALSKNGLMGYVDSVGNWVIPPQFAHAEDFSGEYALVAVRNYQDYAFINRQGNVALEPTGHFETVWSANGTLYIDMDAEGRILAIYDNTMQALDLPAVGRVREQSWGALVWRDEAGRLWVRSGDEAYPVDVEVEEETTLSSVSGPLVTFWKENEDYTYEEGLYNVETGTWVRPMAQGGYMLLEDTVTGERYFTPSYDDGAVHNAVGEYLFTADDVRAPVDGIFVVRAGMWCGLMDETGQWLMRYPMRTSGD